MKSILFYSSVSNMEFFKTQKFYQIDIEILKKLNFNVVLTNSFLDFLKFWKYNCSFCYFYKWSFIPAILSRFLFKKVYFTGGIDDLSLDKDSKRYKRQKLLFRICHFFSTKCFIVSNTDYENVCAIVKDTRKLELSFHSIDVDVFSKNALIEKNNNFVSIAWMSSVDNVIRKGLDNSIVLFSELIKTDEFKNSKFLLAGTIGEGSDYLRQIVSERNIEDKVVFLGNISEEEKIKLLNENKFYFQLSKYEGFGLAALEAVASGSIVIHSGRGGLNDSVGDSGIVIDVDSSIEKQKDMFLISIKNFSKEKIIKNLEKVKSFFSHEKRFRDFMTNII